MSAHTPGPWKVAGPFDGAGRQRYEVQSPELSVASLYANYHDHEAHSYARRDARLIAAAPEMYTALMQANEALGCWATHDSACPGRSEGDEFCSCGLGVAREAVSKAIAKARGR